MENTIEERCQVLINGFFSSGILDFCGYFILAFITNSVIDTLENRHLLHGSFSLQILLPYLLEKLCPKFIYRILSYIYIFTCKSLLLTSISVIGLSSLVTGSPKKTVFCRLETPLATIIVLIPLILNFYFMILDKSYPKQFSHLLYFLVIQPRCNLDPIEQTLDETPVRKETHVDIKDVRINRDGLMLAMETVGQSPTKEGEQLLKDCMGYEEFSALFQESEPSLDEVKEAFYVFDQNRDGLVDARDLQRLLANLGLREGVNIDTCERMIAQHDRNGDSYVDLIDFYRLLEMCFLEKVG